MAMDMSPRSYGIRIRKGFFSFDAAVAVTILIVMIYLTSFVLGAIEASIVNAGAREKQAELLLLSDILVRRGFSSTHAKNVYSNLIDLPSVNAISGSLNASRYRLSNISIVLTGSNGAVFDNSVQTSGAEVYCIQRVVAVNDVLGTYPAVLKVCGS